ncbi:MAG TPA: hypothetical protein PK170_00050 [Anaerolineae bacterium]|nr:hypothetical protein [Anaerolineae bacterium]
MARDIKYPLQGLLLKQRWQLAVQQRELATAQAEQVEARKTLESLQADQAGLLLSLQVTAGRTVDPMQSQGALGYLCELRQRVARQQEQVLQCSERSRALLQECLDIQTRLDALESHRDRVLAQADLALQQRASAQADQEWLARGQTLHAQQHCQEGESAR